MSTFALRLVHSEAGKVLTENNDETAMLGHILGVFVSLDTDKDGFLNKAQLFQGLQLLGLRPNGRLIDKYIQAQMEEQGAAGSAAAAVLAFKVSSSVFVNVTINELRDKKEEMWGDLDPLLSFASNGGGEDKQSMTLSQLRHVLMGVSSPSKLTEAEWDTFVESSLKGVMVGEDRVPIRELKKILYNFDGGECNV
jgi:hypothetical protein